MYAPTLTDEDSLPLLRLAVEQTSDAILITDAQINKPGPHILYVNAAFLRMIDYEESEVIGKTPRILQGPDTNQELLQWLRHCLEQGLPFYGEGINYRKGGRPYQAEWRIAPIRADGGVLTHFMATLRDVTERKRMEEQIGSQLSRIQEYSRQLEAQKADLERANAQLQALATTDGLTGLRNHRDFHESLDFEMRRTLSGGNALSLILADVDHFKGYNDSFGHPAGDDVLKSVAGILKAHTRQGGMAFRYGGEEFALLLPQTGVEEAIRSAESLRSDIEAYAWTRRAITISLGVATQPPRTRGLFPLLEEADQALYESKGAGRNRVSHFAKMGSARLANARRAA